MNRQGGGQVKLPGGGRQDLDGTGQRVDATMGYGRTIRFQGSHR